jgi:alpha-tubulin suppressor-like RCC1 family protein
MNVTRVKAAGLGLLFVCCVFLLSGCPSKGGGGDDPPATAPTTPTTPTTTAPVQSTSVATGDFHTCASLPDNTVQCWGDNTFGQLGIDVTVPRAFSPLTVSGITTASAVSLGGAHSCARLQNGTVRCWGSNVAGQLGNGTTTDSFTPVPVFGLSTATAVTASRGRLDSFGHTCALLTGGTVRCWGRNSVGQLGIGSTTDSSTPITVTALSGLTVTAVEAGGFHTCALISNGTVRCWGDNLFGQLGTAAGTASNSPSPVAVAGLTNVTAIAAGGIHTCALILGGTIRCWGGNGQGRLGNGGTPSDASAAVPNPVTVTGISTAIAITAGRGHSCAILSGGAVRCWGDNSAAMLGNGTTTSSSTPVNVTGIASAVAIAAGAVQTCARLADSTLECWGDNSNGQLGPGSTVLSTTPAAVLTSTAATAATSVSAGSVHNCALFSDSTVGCWGWNADGQLGTAFRRSSTASLVPGITTASSVTAGGWHSCAVLPDGSIKCWGDNSYGQLGNGTLTDSSTPVTVSGIINSGSVLSTTTTTTAVAGGSARTCALITSTTRQIFACTTGIPPFCPSPTTTTTSTVKCWGDNDQGQLGNGMLGNSSTPVTVTGLTSASAITGGFNHTCALLSGGGVNCWGGNYVGQLGNGTTTSFSSVPVAVSGISTATAISSGNMSEHVCAVISGGTVRCWGSNSFGQLGNGTLTDSTVPVTVSGISTATAVAVGESHSCALLSDGTVRCWGMNALGQLGNGTTRDSSTPVTVSGLSSVTGLTAGSVHTCARRSDGGIRCWGDNSLVQLGLGVLASSFATPAGISTIVRTIASVPACVVQSLDSGPRICQLNGNLVIRTGGSKVVTPLPPE